MPALESGEVLQHPSVHDYIKQNLGPTLLCAESSSPPGGDQQQPRNIPMILLGILLSHQQFVLRKVHTTILAEQISIFHYTQTIVFTLNS